MSQLKFSSQGNFTRETLALTMLLRRGETSKKEFTEQFGNLNSSELLGPDGDISSCEGSQLQNWKASANTCNIFPKIGALPGCCESVTREHCFQNALKSDLRICR